MTNTCNAEEKITERERGGKKKEYGEATGWQLRHAWHVDWVVLECSKRHFRLLSLVN